MNEHNDTHWKLDQPNHAAPDLGVNRATAMPRSDKRDYLPLTSAKQQCIRHRQIGRHGVACPGLSMQNTTATLAAVLNADMHSLRAGDAHLQGFAVKSGGPLPQMDLTSTV